MGSLQIWRYALLCYSIILEKLAQLFDVLEDRIEETSVELQREIMGGFVFALQHPLPLCYLKRFKRTTNVLNHRLS